jgi:hypothetical protein
LVEPFGPEIEIDGWSATDWIERVRRAERECVIEESEPPRFPTAEPAAYRDELEEIRTLARNGPTIRPKLMPERGYPAIEQVAYAVARRAATTRLLGCAAVVTVVIFIFLFALFAAFG